MIDVALPALMLVVALAAIVADRLPRRVAALAALTIFIAGAYLEARAPLLAALQVLLYAGGIVVLFGVAVGSTGGVGTAGLDRGAATVAGAVAAAAIFAAGVDLLPWFDVAAQGASADPTLAALVGDRALLLEGVGLVVLVAVVGALALVRSEVAS